MGVVAAGLLAHPAHSQPAADASQRHPAQLLGLRVEATRAALPVAPVVVIATSADAYLDAIEHWSTDARFPVLIDDGSLRAQEDIARFVRAFRPDRVLRWEGDGRMWAQALEVRADRIEHVIATAWGAPDAASLPARWREQGFTPPGVVVANAGDPAWTAAAALGAGRGQPVVWVDSVPGRPGSVIEDDALRTLHTQIEAGVDKLGHPWRSMGEGVDAITLCLSAPTKSPSSRGPVALTDTIGRLDTGARWALTGHILGDEARSAYTAMSAIFLQPTRAWFFDAYEHQGPFAAYAAERGASTLQLHEFTTLVDRRPRARLADLRSRATRPVDADFIWVNSSGQRRWFRIQDTDAQASEIPTLGAPAIVHFVHSFSAQNVDDDSSIAARWLEHGAYVYVGSVDEPGLQAFRTPEIVASMATGRSPLGATVRSIIAPPWKVAYFGDPLALLLGDTAPRIAEMPDLDGAAALDADLRDTLTSGDFAKATRTLVMLGRDADAARLFATIMRETPEQATPDVARAAIWALHRTGQTDALLHACEALADDDALDDAAATDMLWRSLRDRFRATPDPRVVRALRTRVRAGSAEEDARLLIGAIRTLEGDAAADAFVDTLIRDTRNERQRERLRRALTGSP
ncbi:MAG: hypothetical protein EA379_04350 [Phycisphaerales bacterium]|nr:MAG: hypothetical protein EA379_04350 [Phycisphaerales bacterium]